MPPRRVHKRVLATLLRQTRQLKEQMALFRETAGNVADSLDRIIPASEVEVMETPRADLLGTLEEMVNVTLVEADRQLGEIEGVLTVAALDSGESLSSENKTGAATHEASSSHGGARGYGDAKNPPGEQSPA